MQLTWPFTSKFCKKSEKDPKVGIISFAVMLGEERTSKLFRNA